MTKAKITYFDGKVYLECDGNPLAIKISYEGIFNAKSLLPNGFIIQEKNQTIIILRLVNEEFPEALFEYSGRFRIKRADLYDRTNRITALSVEKTHRFYRVQDKWGELNSFWDEYSDDYSYYDSSVRFSSRKRNTDIVTNNLESKSGKLFLKDGTPYYGGVHLHSNGTFMTGGEHSEDSQKLYRKKKKFIKNGIARKI
tara:strand:- start:24 stop:617 length:594 start_codon:yes stop_codon:yes gene_type:complete